MNDRQQELYEREVRERTDKQLAVTLGDWKPGSPGHVIVQREIDRRAAEKAAADQRRKEQREDKRFYWTEFRSWVSVGISVLALAVALGVALYK